MRQALHLCTNLRVTSTETHERNICNPRNSQAFRTKFLFIGSANRTRPARSDLGVARERVIELPGLEEGVSLLLERLRVGSHLLDVRGFRDHNLETNKNAQC